MIGWCDLPTTLQIYLHLHSFLYFIWLEFSLLILLLNGANVLEYKTASASVKLLFNFLMESPLLVGSWVFLFLCTIFTTNFCAVVPLLP